MIPGLSLGESHQEGEPRMRGDDPVNLVDQYQQQK